MRDLMEWTRLDKDKSAWGDGPWMSEPDKRQWVDAATNLPCLMVRSEATGSWCGYVGLPPGHRARSAVFESSYEPDPKRAEAMVPPLPNAWGELNIDKTMWRFRNTPRRGYKVLEEIVECHGGLTFAGPCQKWEDPARGVCHVKRYPGDFDNLRWLGFDCAHAGDVSPAMDALRRTLPPLPGHMREVATELGPAFAKFAETFRDRDQYRDVAYVEAEVAKLAAQLHALGPRRTWPRPRRYFF